jgi:hypothetical protein
MTNQSLIAAASLVLAANAIALIHAARNRTGHPETQVTLTERELRSFRQAEDNTGVTLNLMWTDSRNYPFSADRGSRAQTGSTGRNFRLSDSIAARIRPPPMRERFISGSALVKLSLRWNTTGRPGEP